MEDPKITDAGNLEAVPPRTSCRHTSTDHAAPDQKRPSFKGNGIDPVDDDLPSDVLLGE